MKGIKYLRFTKVLMEKILFRIVSADWSIFLSFTLSFGFLRGCRISGSESLLLQLFVECVDVVSSDFLETGEEYRSFSCGLW